LKERRLTLLFALAALACFYLMLFPTPNAALEQTLPLSTDDGREGYLAAWRWLQAEQVPLTSLRRRYDHLEDIALLPATHGNLLLATLPQRLPLQLAEWGALRRWIERGNTLLVMAALDDTPRWAIGRGHPVSSALDSIIHLHFDARKESASLTPLVQRRVMDLAPLGQHPLLHGVQSVRAVSEFPTSIWLATPTDAALPLALAHLVEAASASSNSDAADNSNPPALWLRRLERGQVIVCAFATPFSNQQLDQADNARLLANIVAWSRSGDGRVVFDDAHQGLVDFYDSAAFFSDARLHRTLAWLLLLWLVFVLGPQRLRRAADGWQSLDETALIRASGRFFSAAVAAPEAARELLANFFNGLRRRLGLREDGEPVWEWLDAQAALSAAQLATLRTFYVRSRAERPVDLKRLHNFLTSLQGRLM